MRAGAVRGGRRADAAHDGEPDSPVWARAGEGPLRVEGAWSVGAPGVVTRAVVVTTVEVAAHRARLLRD